MAGAPVVELTSTLVALAHHWIRPSLFKVSRISEERQSHLDCNRSGVHEILSPMQTKHLLHLALHFLGIRRLLCRHAQKTLTPVGLNRGLLIGPSYYRYQ